MPTASIKRIILVTVFALSFAFVESSVVVYLRALYYPDGFSFPLHRLSENQVLVELFREFSTIVMLVTVGMMAGKTRWEKFSYFLVAFGIWDIFYYVWLKAILNWPVTLKDWDILFLIPVPWIGPVIAPILVSFFLIVAGIMMIREEEKSSIFTASRTSWILSGLGSVCILYSFVRDTEATLYFQIPQPYFYWLLFTGLLCYILALFDSIRKNKSANRSE